jgi:hypothetical protein
VKLLVLNKRFRSSEFASGEPDGWGTRRQSEAFENPSCRIGGGLCFGRIL